MTSRVDASGDYQQYFDLQNRMVEVRETADGEMTGFFYDASGQRTKTVEPDGTTTYYPFPGYEEIRETATAAGGYYWSFDEGTGTAVINYTTPRLDGDRDGGTWQTGYANGGLNLNGSTDTVVIQESVHITKAMTVAAWVRPETGPSGTGRIVISSYEWDADITERKGWTLGDEYGSTDHFQFIVWGDAGTQAVATYSGFFAEYDDEWVHVAGVFKPGQAVELYINGVLEASDTTDVPSELDPSELLEIGSRADSSTQAHWDGDIDEVRVLGDALTGTELQTLSTVGAGSKTERLTISLAGKAYALRTIEKNSSGTIVSSSIRHLLTDHLGSTQATVYHSSGGVVSGSLARYKPFGAYRTTPTADDTDMGFTGHMENRDVGLTYMNARFYVSGIGRFASADSIVPDPTNPQAFNRYSYVLNSPLNFIDLNGHDPLDQAWEDAFEAEHGRKPNDDDRLDRLFSIIFPGSGPNGEWLQEDWDYYNAHKDDLWRNREPWRYETAEAGIDRFVYGLERLASFYTEGEEKYYAKAVGLFWGGIPYGNRIVSAIRASGGPVHDRWFRESAANWDPALVDDRVPSHHYAGLFYTGYMYGRRIGFNINFQRDHDNLPDLLLGDIAVVHASMLDNGIISLGEVALAVDQHIDSRAGNWGPDSPGSRIPDRWRIPERE